MNGSRSSIRFLPSLLAALAVLGSGASPSGAQTVIPRDSNNAYQKGPHAKLRHVLLYDVAEEHFRGKRAVRASMERLAARYGFRLVISEAPIGYLTAMTLAGVDVLVLSQGKEDFAPPGTASDTALKNFIYRDGKALLMIHGAASFKPCPGLGAASTAGTGGDSLGHPDCRFLARAAARQYFYGQSAETPMRIYVDSVGIGEIPPHAALGTTPPTPPAAARDHGIRSAETRAIFTNLPRVLDSLRDEWWSFSSSPRLVGDMERTHGGATYIEGRVNVLLSLDETNRYLSYKSMGDHPIAWTRKMGHGQAAVNTAGHDSLSWMQADSVMEKFNGRLLRYLARDFVGCMDPGSPQYNPEATVTRLTASDPADPCAVVAVQPGDQIARDLSVSARAGVIRVAWEAPGRHAVRIVDLAGKTVFFRGAAGARGGSPLEIRGLRPGIYWVKVESPGGASRVARVSLF